MFAVTVLSTSFPFVVVSGSTLGPLCILGFTIDDGIILPRPSKTKLRPFHIGGVIVEVVVDVPISTLMLSFPTSLVEATTGVSFVGLVPYCSKYLCIPPFK